ncbi:MAG: DUF5686 family protein [Bacteroidota bacterium]
MYKTYIFFLLFLAINLQANSQVTRIRGTITDADTGEPLPFVSIYLQNTQIGTITNQEGEYFIECREASDSITVSYMGYKPQTKAVQKNKYQEIDFLLQMDHLLLDEIVILPTENPAHIILRNIIKNKHKHNPERFDTYSFDSYNKVKIGTDNINERIKNKRFLGDFKFVFNYVDTSAISGKAFLPLLISETISEFYYDKSTDTEKEIIKSSRISGFENTSISKLAGQMYQRINIYENYLTIFEPGFVSPISDHGLLFYKYYLIDSTFIENKWCYQISYVPKREQDRTFRGNFWVHDTTFAIKSIQMRTAKNINYNYIKDFFAEYEYKTINDSVFFLERENIYFDFDIDPRLSGFFANKTCIYDNIQVNKKIPEEVLKYQDKIVMENNIFIDDEAFWKQNRSIPLSVNEENIYIMIDSVQNAPIYKYYEKLAEMFIMFHYEIGYFELGPYFQTFSFNEIEGNRFRLSGRTSNKFSTDLMIKAYGAYGLKDERFKYGGGLMYMFNKNPRSAISIDGKYDLKQLGQSELALKDDNIFKSLLQRTPNNSLTMVSEVTIKAEKEWYQGFSNNVVLSHQRIESGEFLKFQKELGGEIIDIDKIINTEIGLNIRIAEDEKFLRGEFENKSLGTVKPIVNINLAAGLPGILDSEYEYYKVSLDISQKVDVSPLGYFRYILDCGKIFGTLPYPLLKIHEGNETYIFDRYAYNMMNYFEFASDTYFSIYVDYHMQGLIFNRIPYFKKLKLREVFSAKGLTGSLSKQHSELMLFPEGMSGLKHPYYEVSAGIENIFKLFRVDAVWRLNYLEKENVDNFGWRITMQFTF